MSTTYDVFLLHDGVNKAAVEAIAVRLRDAGLQPFFDGWHLVPGDLRIPALEAAMVGSPTIAVLIGSKGMEGWHDQQKQLALVLAAEERGKRVIPVLLAGASRQSLKGFLGLRTGVDFDEDDGFRRLVAGILGQAPELVAEPGTVRRWSLLAKVQREIIDFAAERNRHEHFFGREDVLARLDGWLEARDSGWLLLTGGPGLGKSALLNRWLKTREAAGLPTAFHFIRRGHLDWADPQTVQANLAAQVEVMFPEQRDAEADPAYRLEQLLQRVSPVLAKTGQRLVLLVDGLDEAMTLGKRKAEDNPIPKIFPLEVPSRVFLVAASRPEYPHLGWFDRRTGPTEHVDLDALGESNERAVRKYWTGLGGSMTPPLDEALLRAAIFGARGNLLHAVKLRELWSRPGAKRLPDDVPQGFEGMLEELWGRIGELKKSKRKRAREGLSLVCAARESLPLRVVETLLGWDEGDARDDFLPLAREMLHEEAWHEEPAYRPFHEGLRELVEDRQSEAVDGHLQRLAEYAAWPVEGDEFRREYALRHRVEHLVEMGDREAAANACMDLEFLTAKSCVEGVHAVERDIQLAAESRTHDTVRERLIMLGRLVVASAHWASEVPEALPALLHDRALTNAPKLLQHWVGPSRRLPDHPRLRHPLQIRGMSRILQGHQGVVNALAVLPDCRIVSGSSDNTLCVWDVEIGRAVTTLQCHQGVVNALAVLPDGRIVSGSSNGTLQVWDLEAGRAVATLQGHQDWVRVLAVLPNGRVVSGSDDNTLRVWDVATGRALATLKGHTGWVTALALLPDGRVVSSSNDGTLRVWDVQAGRALATLQDHEDGVNALAVLPDGRIVSDSADRTLRVWDMTTGRAFATLHDHQERVRTLAMLPDGRVVSGLDDKTLRVWDMAMGRAVATLHGHQGVVNALAVLPDGRIVSGSVDGTLRVWDVDAGRDVATFQCHQDGVIALATLPDGRVVSGSVDSTLRVWDVDAGRDVATLQGHQGRVWALAVLPDGRVVSGSGDDTLRVWDVDTGRDVTTLRVHQGVVNALAVLPDGRVVSGSGDNALRVWDVDTGRAVTTIQGHQDWVNALAVLPDGRVVSGSSNGTLRVWDVDTGRAVVTIQGHQDWVNALAVLPDGRIVSGSSDGTLRVWDVDTGRAVTTLQGHQRVVNALAVLPDGCVVSGSDDKTLRVWKVEMGRILSTVYGDAAFLSVSCVDQHLVVAGDAIGNVWFIDLPDLPRA